MDEFKVGDRVLITKPKDGNKYGRIGWHTCMDKCDGQIGRILLIDADGDYFINDWSFHEDWLTLVEEMGQFKVGDMVRITKPDVLPNDFGGCHWEPEMDKYDGQVKRIEEIYEDGDCFIEHWFFRQNWLTFVDDDDEVDDDDLKDCNVQPFDFLFHGYWW